MSTMSTNKAKDDEKYISVPEAAAMLGITGRHVRRLIQAGVFKARRLTPVPKSRYRILESSVKEFLEAQK